MENKLVRYEKTLNDNRHEIAIFYDEAGKKYLKRFIMNSCDANCETIKQILEG